MAPSTLPSLLILCLGCGLAGFLILLLARWRRRRLGLPAGAIGYSDTGAERTRPAVLVSERHRLTGRPDYLVRRGRQLVPVEVKSGPAPARPYRSHRLQLAAYCLLVTETHGRPRAGVLRYADRAFEVAFTPELERELLDVLAEMRIVAAQPDPPACLPDDRRCRRCGFAADCAARVSR